MPAAGNGPVIQSFKNLDEDELSDTPISRASIRLLPKEDPPAPRKSVTMDNPNYPSVGGAVNAAAVSAAAAAGSAGAAFETTSLISHPDISNLTIYQVCRTGDAECLKAILKRRAAKKVIDLLDPYDLSPMHYCAKYNQYDCARLLVNHGASVRTVGIDQTTPLHYCAIYRKSHRKAEANEPDLDMTNQGALIHLFCQEANPPALVDAQDRYGCTALHMASYKGNKDAVIDLLDCGANVEARDNQEMTSLHMAASYGFEDICQILLFNNASLLATDKEQSTPLHLAAASGHAGIVKMLLDSARERDAKITLRVCLSAVDTASQTPIHAAVDNNRYECARILLEFGAAAHEPKDGPSGGRTYPLHMAAQNGELPMLELIFKYAKAQTGRRDVDISNCRNKCLETPLHRAALFNRASAVEFLLEHGADIDAIEDEGFTPLLVAVSKGNDSVTELLLQRKADFRVCDSNSKNIFHWCVECEDSSYLVGLLDKSDMLVLINDRDVAGNTPMHVAARNGSVEIMKMLHEKGAEITLKNEDEQTPLHLCAKYGRTRAVRWICETDDDTVMDEDENSNTAIHLAAIGGHEKVVSVLINFQADVEARNMQQWTPLDCAAAAGWVRTSRILLENDAPVDAVDKSSITPLYLACKNNHPEVVRLLLDWEASLEIRASDGKNPLDIAIESGSKQSVEVILGDKEWWQFALQNRTAFNDNDKVLMDTPLRKLVRMMPDLAVKAFNNCIEIDKDHAPNDSNFSLKLIYEYIDDDYSMTNWLPEKSLFGDGTSSKGSGSTAGSTAGDSSNVYFSAEGGRKPHVTEDARTYCNDTKLLIKNHPLSVMVSSEEDHLLQHPLVLMLLKHKWRSFGRLVYYVNLLQYAIFLLFLTGYVIVTKPKRFWKPDQNFPDLATYIKDGDSDTHWIPFYVFHIVGQYPIIVLAVLNLIREVFQLLSRKLHYFTSGVNIIEVGTFALSLLLVVPTTLRLTNEDVPTDWQWQCGSIAIFLAWINLVLFIQKFPKFGIYVVMFTDILITFFKFFVVFFLFIFAFALGFYTLLQNKDEFSTVYYSMMKTGVMMIGEFEFVDLFWGTGSPMSGSWRATTLVFFVVFAIVMSIITMNLLVGLAVDDIKAVQDSATLTRMAMQVELALQVEQTLPEFIRRRFVIREETIYPNQKGAASSFMARYMGSDELDGATIIKSLNVQHEPIEEVMSSQEKMLVQLKNMNKQMCELMRQQSSLKTKVDAIATKTGVVMDDDDYHGDVNDDEI